MATTAAVVGCTGLVGSFLVSTLLALPQISKISTYSRRAPKSTTSSPPDKLDAFTSSESEQWTSRLRATVPSPRMFLSALGTTRAQAGGLQNQYKIDYDLNIALAKAAKEAGVSIYTLISSGGANRSSVMGYLKLKEEIEDAVKAIGFEHTIILRPGYLMGNREQGKALEKPFSMLTSALGRISWSLTDFWAVDAEIVARAAAHASLICAEGKREPGLWMLTQSDIVRLGRTEWPMGGGLKAPN